MRGFASGVGLTAALALAISASSAQAAKGAAHVCAADARAKALALLRLHGELDASNGSPEGAIDEKVVVRAPVRALKGKGLLDVLEVNGYIYKATYRIRMIYVVSFGQCALLGQEILEVADPF